MALLPPLFSSISFVSHVRFHFNPPWLVSLPRRRPSPSWALVMDASGFVPFGSTNRARPSLFIPLDLILPCYAPLSFPRRIYLICLFHLPFDLQDVLDADAKHKVYGHPYYRYASFPNKPFRPQSLVESSTPHSYHGLDTSHIFTRICSSENGNMFSLLDARTLPWTERTTRPPARVPVTQQKRNPIPHDQQREKRA